MFKRKALFDYKIKKIYLNLFKETNKLILSCF